MTQQNQNTRLQTTTQIATMWLLRFISFDMDGNIRSNLRIARVSLQLILRIFVKDPAVKAVVENPENIAMPPEFTDDGDMEAEVYYAAQWVLWFLTNGLTNVQLLTRHRNDTLGILKACEAFELTMLMDVYGLKGEAA